MRIRRIVDRAVKLRGNGLNVDAGVNAVVSANVNEKSRTTTTVSSSRQTTTTRQEGERQ